MEQFEGEEIGTQILYVVAAGRRRCDYFLGLRPSFGMFCFF